MSLELKVANASTELNPVSIPERRTRSRSLQKDLKPRKAAEAAAGQASQVATNSFRSHLARLTCKNVRSHPPGSSFRSLSDISDGGGREQIHARRPGEAENFCLPSTSRMANSANEASCLS